MAAVIGNRNISLGVMGGTLITAACYGGGDVFGVTPYDKATTRYLKATYPAYWVQIRDYGFANPQLVPWINEDNDLIVSLVSVGKERWLHRTGLAYIDTGILVNAAYPFEMDCKWVEYYSNRGCILSNYSSDAVGIGYELDGNSYVRHYFNGDKLNTSALGLNTEHTIHSTYNAKTGKIVSIIDGTTYNPSSAVQSGVASLTLLWMTDHRISTLSAEVKQARQRILANGIEHTYCPMTHNGEKGLLDLYDLQFYPNANTSGTFTIEITDR